MGSEEAELRCRNVTNVMKISSFSELYPRRLPVADDLCWPNAFKLDLYHNWRC